MAFCRTGSAFLKSIKPVLVNPFFIIPSSVNFQVRHAARRSYREKAIKKKKQKEAEKPSDTVTKEIMKLKRKSISFTKTVDRKKPDPPNDDIIIMDHFKYKKFSLSEVVKFHREYHHPTVYNNPTAPVILKIEINMLGKAKNQFIKPFSGIVDIPYPIPRLYSKQILVLCDPKDKELALSCGASVAGGAEVIEKIKEGVIQPVLFEYVITHINFLPNITPIRGLLKNKLPRAKVGTLTNNLEKAIRRFLHGLEYSCVQVKSSEDLGIITCQIGSIDMDLNHLEKNFKALLKDIETFKPSREGDFITWIWCMSPPSPEQFALDLPLYMKKQEKSDIGEEEEEEDLSEREAAKELKRRYDEEKLMEEKI